jgi:hypothetical protein
LKFNLFAKLYVPTNQQGDVLVVVVSYVDALEEFTSGRHTVVL